MKKSIKLLVWFILMVGWIYGFVQYNLSFSIDEQAIWVLLFWAPFTEEFIFRESFYQIGKRWNCMGVVHILSSVFFAYCHQGNYFVYGTQYAFAAQGMMSILIFQVRREYNLFWCMVFHAGWNATIFFIFN